MFKDYTLQTTWRRTLVALVVGTIIASFGFMYLSAFSSWRFYVSSLLRPQNIFSMFLALFSISGIAVFSIFLPIGLLMYKFGFRTWISAALVGYVVPVIYGLFWLFVVPSYAKAVLGAVWWTHYYWAEPLIKILSAGLLVVPIALIIWRIAYRRLAPC